MRLGCIFGKHKWFWETIEIEFDKASCRTWNTLRFKICTCCGKVKIYVQGKNDVGRFRAICGKQIQENDFKNNW